MILQKSSFFTIKHIAQDEKGIAALLEINPGHAIFEGHFPGQPVVPGVCMLQMIKEVGEKALNRSLFLQQAAQIKYLQVLVPVAGATVDLKIEWKAELSFNASLKEGDQTIMKMSGIFQ